MIDKAKQFFDVFSQFDLEEITAALRKLQDQPNDGKFFAYTNGFRQNDHIFPFIKKNVITKIEKLVESKICLTVGMYLKEEIPWMIHTDYIKGDIKPKGAFLIPLCNENTHTVVFNEECLTTFDNYLKLNKKLEKNAKNLYNTLCSHETENHLEHVSLYAVYKWHPGSVIYWDRKLLHCSDNFLVNGVKEKTALVLFTNDDENL